MTYRFKDINFPDRETAMAWETNNRKVADHIAFSRAHPLPDEEWKTECRRVREYGTGKPRVAVPAPVDGGESPVPSRRSNRREIPQDAEAQRLLAEASALAGGVEGEVRESTRVRAKEREATAKLVAFAREHGLWNGDIEGAFDAKYGTGDGEKNTEGGEAIVWFDRARGVAVKAIGLDYYGSPTLALDRIALHNRYFPSVPLSLVGFGEVKDLFDAKGELELRGRPFNTVVEQPIVDRTRELTRSEIRSALEALGFRPVRDRRVLGADMETPDGKAIVSDLHEQNVFGLPDGSIAVIDCDIRAKDAAFAASDGARSEPDRNRPGHHVLRNHGKSTG